VNAYEKILSNLLFFLPKRNFVATERICSETECYTVIERLGAGAFGVVYSVEDYQGQKFALKSYKIRNL